MSKIKKLHELDDLKKEKEKEKSEEHRKVSESYEHHFKKIDEEIRSISEPFTVEYKNSKGKIYIRSYYQPISKRLDLDIDNLWNNTTVDDIMRYCAIYESYILANEGDIERMPSQDEIELIINRWKEVLKGIVKDGK